LALIGQLAQPKDSVFKPQACNSTITLTLQTYSPRVGSPRNGNAGSDGQAPGGVKQLRPKWTLPLLQQRYSNRTRNGAVSGKD
jgi:hypothetical protein